MAIEVCLLSMDVDRSCGCGHGRGRRLATLSAKPINETMLTRQSSTCQQLIIVLNLLSA